VNRPAPILSPPYEVSTEQPITSLTCGDCDGAGAWLEAVRVSGEHFDADQREVICGSCDGDGEVPCDPRCPYCERELTGSCCDDCATVYLAPDFQSDGVWL